ncbi:MAG: SH3 domain-containing protein [Candidatus Omnitrophica bacterium]|nr:SH3 domain-containing protein [Candidatus Omnitrophota bacterium]
MQKIISLFLKINALSVILLYGTICFAQETTFPFIGQSESENVNLRTDATINSQVICTLSKNEQIEVISESFEWYKIRLPNNAPSFVKKNLTECIGQKPAISPEEKTECKTAKITKNRVNIRLAPNETAPILGVSLNNEAVNIISEEQGWYKIEPIPNSFGWVHKKFISKIEIKKEEPKPEEPKKVEADVQENLINLEGIIKPYGRFFKRSATHKIITADNKIFLLKADKKILNAANQQKVKIKGRLVEDIKEKYPVIEVTGLEVIK